MSELRIRVALLLVGSALLLPLARSEAQTVKTDTVSAPLFPDRSSAENGWLSRFSLDREPQGGRSRGMGGTGMAMRGGAESHVYNPASILGMTSLELGAEFMLYSGKGSASSFPSQLQISPTDFLDASNYRVHPRGQSSYNFLGLGLPVILFGDRGAFALSYRREALTGYSDESRVELQGTLTSNAQATYGKEDLPKQGMDAITFTVARQLFSKADLGINLNWQGGTLLRETGTGISILGNEFASGSSSFQQDVSGFNIDAGTMLHFGPLNLGGAIYLPHDIKFRKGEERILTIPAAPAFDTRFLVLGRPLDQTLSVPTMFSVGSSYQVNERLSVSADFLYRPWGHAEITRARVEPVIGFLDPADPTTYAFTLVPVAGEEETFWAGLSNTHSLRAGMEYYFKKSADLDFPVRLGFRLENLAQRNVLVPSVDPRATGDKAYNGAILLYYDALQNDPNCTSGDCQKYRDFLKNIDEFNYLAFAGDPIGTTTITLGAGVRISEWSADLTLERTSFKVSRFFLSNFDPILNPIPATTFESRSAINVVFSTTMRF
jgi:hypothetical protein